MLFMLLLHLALYRLYRCICLFSCIQRITRCMFFFFFKQKTAYEMRISDWSSDVCSSDLRQRSDLAHKPLPAFHCLADICLEKAARSPAAFDSDNRRSHF